MDKKEIQILANLVSFNTIDDKENVNIINYIEKYLLNLNFKLEKKDRYLIMSIGENHTLGFLGHSDTVEYINGWTSNPFEVTQRGDLLYGLGVCDMKGGISAFLTAISEIDLTKLKNGIKVYITYNEEIGFKGIQDIVRVEKQFPIYNIIGEPTNNVIMTGCKGLLAVKLKTTGIKVHSSMPHKGKSANDGMINLLSDLRRFYEENIKDDKNSIYEIPYTTMNIGLLNGGSAINSVSAECNSYVDFRIAKNEHIDLLKNEIERLCKLYDGSYIIDIEIKPFYEDIDFIKESNTAGFMTEASFIQGKRIILGPGPVTAHEVNEHITVQSLRETVEQYKYIINEVCM